MGPTVVLSVINDLHSDQRVHRTATLWAERGYRVVVVGPSQLYGSTVQSPDVRAGMALLIAALCAKGTTTIGNIRQIDRGYERIDEKLRALGARIERAGD